MPGIFISYRRLDSQSAAGRLADHLNEHLSGVSVFRDVETIEPGVDFVEAIEKALSSCAAMLVVIGPRWVSATDATGKRRLDDPDDYTRLEVATALKRNVRVIPVLVEGAAMPAADDLPEDLKPLARRNAIELTDSRWPEDVRRLVASLERALGMGRGGAQLLVLGRYRWALLLLALILVGGSLYGLKDRIWGPGESVVGEVVVVPNLIGASREEALAGLRAAGLELAGVHGQVTVRIPPGQVIEQEPKPGREVPRGTGVELFLAEAAPEEPGPVPVAPPETTPAPVAPTEPTPVPTRPAPTPARVRPTPTPTPIPPPPESPPGLPDLTVALEGPSRAAPRENIGDRLVLLVRNLGEGTAAGTLESGQDGYVVDIVLTRQGAPAVRLAVYSERFRDGALLRGGRVSRTRSLGSGEQAEYRASAIIPPETPLGEYCLGAVVDAGQRVREGNEDNNTACHRILVTARPQADLAVSRLVLSPSVPIQGQTVTVRVAVSNRGEAASAPYSVAWWPGEDYPEPACRWDDLPGLRPGASRGLSCEYAGYPSWYGRIRSKVEILGQTDAHPENNREFMEIRVSRP